MQNPPGDFSGMKWRTAVDGEVDCEFEFEFDWDWDCDFDLG